MNELLNLDRFSNRLDQEHNLEENALFFQHEGKQLFGIFHRPLNKTDVQKRMGIVMCQPYLIEPLITQRLEVDIARSLAQKGFPVFRFHYRGCGDSEGNFKEATLSSQVADTLRAIEVFTEQEKLDSICLLGIRLGGTVALMAAELEKRVEFLILCEPIIELKNYFLDLLRTNKFSALINKQETISTERMIENLVDEGSMDVLGYPLYKEIVTETESLNLTQSTTNFSGKTLLIQVAAFSSKIRNVFQGMCDRVRENGGSCDIKVILERKLVWDFITHPPIRSEKIVQTVLQWCEEQIAAPGIKVLDKVYDNDNSLCAHLSEKSEDTKIIRTEYPVFIQGKNYDLFGILHVPDKGLLHEKTVAILLNGTSIPRTHRNRMGVRLARYLTEMGFFTFRFDYCGLGESTGVAETGNLNQLHTQDAVKIVDFLSKLIRPTRIIFIGTCFGARTALSTLQHRKFHGLVFISAPTVNEDGRATHKASKKSFVRNLRKLRDWRKWGYFLDFEKIKRNLVYLILRGKNKLIQKNIDSLVHADFSNQFFALIKEEVPSLIIYGTLDEYYENVKQFVLKIDQKKRQNIEFVEVAGEDVHSFVPAYIQDIVIEKILNWITLKYLPPPAKNN